MSALFCSFLFFFFFFFSFQDLWASFWSLSLPFTWQLHSLDWIFTSSSLYQFYTSLDFFALLADLPTFIVNRYYHSPASSAKWYRCSDKQAIAEKREKVLLDANEELKKLQESTGDHQPNGKGMCTYNKTLPLCDLNDVKLRTFKFRNLLEVLFKLFRKKLLHLVCDSWLFPQ